MRWGAGRKEGGGNTDTWIDPHVHILPPRRMAGLVRWVKSFTPGFPLSIISGTFFAARAFSTSLSPLSIKSYCLKAAPIKFFARQNMTKSGDFSSRAVSWAKRSAQLSAAR